ncbi:hypothetical protein ACFL1H_04970 [Nanoarchaeota archaeon]
MKQPQIIDLLLEELTKDRPKQHIRLDEMIDAKDEPNIIRGFQDGLTRDPIEITGYIVNETERINKIQGDKMLEEDFRLHNYIVGVDIAMNGDFPKAMENIKNKLIKYK